MRNNRSVSAWLQHQELGFKEAQNTFLCISCSSAATAARFCIHHSSAFLPGKAHFKSRLPGFQGKGEFPLLFGKTLDKGSQLCPAALPGLLTGSSAAGKAGVSGKRRGRGDAQ